jgi:hypothetical protein
MNKTTVSADGEAMPEAILTRHNLINQTTGDVNVAVLKGLVRRRAMQDYGAITPRSRRSALREYAGMIPELKRAWRERHGLTVATTMVCAYGIAREGVRRSAF